MTEAEIGRDMAAQARSEGHRKKFPEPPRGLARYPDSYLDVLAALCASRRPLMTDEISERVGGIHNSVQSRLSAMITAGLIEKVDRVGRQHTFRLTAKGRRTLKEGRAA